jgi:hypothetical protein
MGCCQGLHHPIIISNQHPNKLSIHSLPLSYCCYCKKQQPIGRKTETTHLGENNNNPLGFPGISFFLSQELGS